MNASNHNVLFNSFIAQQFIHAVSCSTQAENVTAGDVGHCSQLYSVSGCEWAISAMPAELAALALADAGGHCYPPQPWREVLIPWLAMLGAGAFFCVCLPFRGGGRL